MSLHTLWQWIANHWKWWGVPSAIATAGGIITALYKLLKARAEAEITRRRAQQEKLALETKGNAQIILIFANTIKQKVGTQDFEFSEEMLRGALGNRAPRLHAIMEVLRDQGKARKSATPGHWIID